MCNINLPNVSSFLLMYTLRFGCFVILSWTLFRSGFSLFFSITVLMEAVIPRSPSSSRIFIKDWKNAYNPDNMYPLYFCTIILIIVEAFIFLFCFYFFTGLHYYNPSLIKDYVIVRFCCWMAEVLNIIVLTLLHKLLIGWYLGFLFFIILELYGVVVVYSYYLDLKDLARLREVKSEIESYESL